MIELKYNFLQWFKRYYFLYVFIFLVNFQPFYPFLNEIIVTNKNLTEAEYSEEVQPVASYTSVAVSLLIFLLIEFTFFNYVFILTIIGGLVVSACLWQGHDITELQVAQGFYGGFVAAEIIIHAAIYVCHETRSQFRKLTAFIRAFALIAKMLAAILAQVLISNGAVSFETLAFMALPAFVHAALLVVHFPPMCDVAFEEPPDTLSTKVTWLRNKFKTTFRSKHILKWSLWSAFTLFTYTQLINNIQPIWREGQLNNNEIPYNGGVETISSFLSLLGVFLSGIFAINVNHEHLFLAGISLLHCGLLFGFATVNSIWDVTIFYMALSVLYNFKISVLFSLIAERVHRYGSVGMTFAFIGLVYALLNCLQAVLTKLFNFSLQVQFFAYATCYSVFAFLVMFGRLLKLCLNSE